jgi:hypothetical protein
VLTHRRGLDVLTGWANADARRLGFFDHSVGAFQGALRSAVEPRLSRLVLASFGSGTLVRLIRHDMADAREADREPAAPPRQWREYDWDHATPACPAALRDPAEFLLSLRTMPVPAA